MYTFGGKHLHNCSKLITTYYPDTSPVWSIIDHVKPSRLQKKDETKCLSFAILCLRNRLSRCARLYPFIRCSCNWPLGMSRYVYLFRYSNTCLWWSCWHRIFCRRERSTFCSIQELSLE